MNMEIKVYSPWAFTENEREKSKINHEMNEQLKQKYRVYRNGSQIYLEDGVDLNFDDYDIIIGRKTCYHHGEYIVYKNMPKLTNDELALLCDDGNLCFGYTYDGEDFHGNKKFYVFED